MKKTISIFLSVIIALCLATSVYCESAIQPLWDHTFGVFASIDFTGTKGTFTAIVNANSDVTDIYAMAYLYYKDTNGDWVEQTGWGALSSTNVLGMDRTFTGISGVEYKCEFTAYVYVGLDCEEVHYTAYETCP